MANVHETDTDWTSEVHVDVPESQKQILAKTIDEEVVLRELTIRENDAAAMRNLRRDSAKDVIRLFSIANLVILAVVVVAAATDYIMIAADVIDPPDRLINNTILVSLIGATTVQLGAVIYTIYQYLFPGGENSNAG